VLGSTLARTTANDASVIYSRCVQQRPRRFPIAPMGDSRLANYVLLVVCRTEWYVLLLKSSHRPDGIFTNSYVSRLCLQGGGVYVQGGTVTLSSCTITGNTARYVRAHAQNFPSPPWETHVCLVVCRVAVLLSLPAQSQSSTPKCIPIKLPMCALMLNSSHRPDGKMADVLTPTHACTTANTWVNYRWYVPQRP
jgi:hypothetical protein